MWSEGKGKKMREGKSERGVMDDSKVFGLRNGGVELASIQIGKAAEKKRFVTEGEEFKFWTCPISLRVSCFLHPISKCRNSSRLSSLFSFPFLDDLMYSYGFKYHLDIQPTN